MDRGEQAGRYRGTVALNVAVPDWPWELTLLGLDVWEGCVTLRGTSAFDLENSLRRPSGWGMATDRPTVHVAGGSGMHGSTPSRWHVEFAPSLPDDATELRVFVGPPVANLRDHAPLPNEPTIVVPLTVWPLTPRLAAATVSAPTSPLSASSGSRSSVLVDRAVRPDHVISVSTQLDDSAGGDLCVLAIEAWPSCFDLHVATSGWWGRGDEPRDSPSIWGRHHRLQWRARDDRGGEYRGQYQGGLSVSISAVEVSFAPALDPSARALTLEFPSPFDDESVIRSTIELSTFESPA